MTLANLQDFEDYQYLHNYQDFEYSNNYNPLLNGENHSHDVSYYVNNCLPAQPVSNFASSSNNNETQAYQHPQQQAYQCAYENSIGPLMPYFPEEHYENNEEMAFFSQPGLTTPSSSDVIVQALALADARKCDTCDYPFTDENGPEVYSGCGHMVCRSCYIWCYDLSQGRCAHCNNSAGRQVLPVNHVVEAHVPQKNSPMMTSTMTIQPQQPKKHQENVVLSFPSQVQFIMSKEEAVVPGSPDKRMFQYSITADTVAVKVDADTSLSTALDFLKDIHIEEASLPSSSSSVASSSSPPELKKQKKSAQSRSPPLRAISQGPPPRQQQQKNKTVKRSTNTRDNFPTILIGTQGQIKRAVKRQAQQMDSHNSNFLPLTKSTVVISPTGLQGQYHTHNQAVPIKQLQPQQTVQRRVVLIPNLSKLSSLNLCLNNVKSMINRNFKPQ